MSIPAILLPVFALMALLFVLLFLTSDLRRGAKPAASTGAVRDQLSLPLFFLVLVAIAMPLRQTDLLFVLLSWVFVIACYAQAGIVVTSDDARQRGLAFFAAAIVLFVMWLAFALKILFAL
jgi:hypothetical protein